MSHKKAGIIVAIGLLILALLVFILSNLELVPKDNKQGSEQNEKPATSSIVVDESASSEESTATEDSSTSEPESSSSGLSLVEIVAEEKLDYDSPEQQTTGVVSRKSCYLSGTQVVYCIEMQATMGTETKDVTYFCSYSVYSQVEEGDILNIAYKQTTTNTFALMSVSK